MGHRSYRERIAEIYNFLLWPKILYFYFSVYAVIKVSIRYFSIANLAKKRNNESNLDIIITIHNTNLKYSLQKWKEVNFVWMEGNIWTGRLLWTLRELLLMWKRDEAIRWLLPALTSTTTAVLL